MRVPGHRECLPLSEFRSGHQLVAIVLNCLGAHKEAYKKAKVMHRDVSSGNIFIYPEVAYRAATGSYHVMRTGILADWELSKPANAKETPMRPRQPPRTGTWQLLSAAMLSSHGKAAKTQDEPEAHVHVLLYHAIRYLNSNCEDVAEFIESYFDAHTYSLLLERGSQAQPI
ncbi:hypothetical protein GY45DRAFT_1376437 [Cubamyces sp. BRFM 1775]|nr:hypothetical protein GY45DRAFT_1376437 [Cubamyces sp. BRFM 1775]